MSFYQQLLIACPLVFLAGFVDAVAGGGGLISLPAYYMAGLPPHFALGTNKLSSSAGTIFSTATYLRGRYIYRPIIIISVAGALAGSWIGAQCALLLDEQVLRWVMMFIIPVITIVTMLKRNLFSPGERNMQAVREQFITAAIALTIGWYDGFFGPGAGTFLMLAFVGVLRLDAVTASGNAKVVNLCSNLAAAAAFIAGGAVNYALALPCAAFSILGNTIGAKLTIKNGARIIRPMMLAVVGLLMVTIIRDLL